MKRLLNLSVIIALMTLFACNKDGVIVEEDLAPVIAFDSETGIYAAKAGRSVTVTPKVKNGEGASFAWIIDGATVSDRPVFEHVFAEAGTVYVTLRVENRYGRAEEELRIDVDELMPPVIALDIPAEGIAVAAGREYRFEPEVQSEDVPSYAWYLDGGKEPVSTEKDYTFRHSQIGAHTLLFTAANGDGKSERRIAVEVTDGVKAVITFIPSCFGHDPSKRTVSLGRTIFLRPLVANVSAPEYSWYVDGEPCEGCDGRMFAFTPAAEGKYKVRIRVTDGAEGAESVTESEIEVTCYPREADRDIATVGKAAAEVVEFMPAPGQFVNDAAKAGYSGQSTVAEALDYARSRIRDGLEISLGGFGGYVIAAFDHSVANNGGYEFSVAGNQIDTSNEPGVVWVMQDVNGNGLPDDEWYELRGSETGKEQTVQEYAVTYYKPSAPRQSVRWTDNLGGRGTVNYLAQFHSQDYYYPLWLQRESQTYYGTRLAQNTTQGDMWSNDPYEWGYADNTGSDNLTAERKDGKTYFRISNAMTLDGRPADLRYIDFVKVQSAVNGSAGVLGEVSTEVVGIFDESAGR